MSKIFSQNKDLSVEKSRNGSGIKIKRTFHKGEKIFEVTGTFITCYEDDVLDEKIRANTYRYDEELFLNPQGKLGDFLNHSCNPNAKVVKKDKRLFIYSIKTILSGREVLIDYSTILAADDEWQMICNCGSIKCRKKVKKFKLLPKSIREKYIKDGIVPTYILQIK